MEQWICTAVDPQLASQKEKKIYFCDRGKFKHAPGSLLI